MYTPTTFTSDLFPNCHIEFDSQGLKLRVSLNIEKCMVKYLAKNNVFKAEKFYIYTIACYVDKPSLETMKLAHTKLIARAMENCRIAKQQVLQQEINNLRLIFN